MKVQRYLGIGMLIKYSKYLGVTQQMTYDLFMSIFEKGALGSKRAELLPLAYGMVLEIGSGTGVNLSYYDSSKVSQIILTDKSIKPILFERVNHSNLNIEVKEVDVEDIPYESKMFDTIVVTLVFCSVNDVQKGLMELKRVLKEEGQILFIEHVLPEVHPYREVFNTLTPVWKRIASGCHLNRDFEESLRAVEFTINEVSVFYNSAFISGRASKSNGMKE